MAEAARSATVEVLTAEVRVLMVGSRQVTLSVARQLDWVALDELEPFGRIRLGQESEGTHSGAVIGRRSNDGALVCARWSLRGHGRPALWQHDLGDRRVIVCGWWKAGDGEDYVLRYGTRDLWVAKRATVPCAEHDAEKRPWNSADARGCPHWYSNGCDQQIKDVIGAHDDLVGRHHAMAKLPLIVLAGLR